MCEDAAAPRPPQEPSREERKAWLVHSVMPHEPWVRSRLRKLALPAEVIEDLIHDAYVRLLAVDDVSHVIDARNYFAATARSLVISRARRANCVSEEAHDADYFVQLRCSDPGPDVIAEGRFELAKLDEALRGLGERRRQILLLRRVERLTCRETAERLRISQSSVEKELRFTTLELAAALS